ncbi:uncharacterized protein LTR77_004788 [Saxophila tyrrhenica]|uniref:F-box domain-containing protein n=1 Tax=Saxophila tyrrhenica TaxID=1690608 RepID=A0AAV9PA24_9PEZI|nr:hypothetical protein LTR77_004788 [Saxophila tyrrhenica]
MADINALPPELLDHIAGFCDHATLKSLRRVCKSSRDAATPGVFEHFYMAMFDHCLENLCSISKSPLAKHVKAFTFYTDVLPDWTGEIPSSPDDLDWPVAIDFRPEIARSQIAAQTPARQPSSVVDVYRQVDYDSLPRHNFSDEELKQGWREFEKLREQQSTWRKSEQPSMRFKEYFAMLPNVTEVHVTTCLSFPFFSSGARPARELPLWSALRRRMLVGPDDWTDEYEYPDNRSKLCGQGFSCMLEAIGFRASFAGTRHVTKLHAHATHYGSLQFCARNRAYPCSKPWPATFECMRQGFENLTAIEFTSACTTYLTPGDEDEAIEEIFGMLCAATKLKSLKLVYESTVVGSERDYNCFGRRLQKHPPWPPIESLELSVTFMPYWDLLPVLQTLAPTLRSLKLRDTDIVDIRPLVAQIPKILDLQHAYLECIWHWCDVSEETNCLFMEGTDVGLPYERSVKRYLTRKIDKMPDLKLCSCEEPYEAQEESPE